MSELLKKYGIKPAEASKRTGISPVQWSRWLNGEQTFISDDDFETMSTTLFKRPHEQAQLLRGRMLDMCKGPGADLIDIRVRGENHGTLHDAPPPYKSKLPANIQRDVDTIVSNVKDRRVRQLVHSLASYIGGKVP